MRTQAAWTVAALVCLTAGCEATDPVTGVPMADAPAAAGVVPTVAQCGDQISTDFKLANDLLCTGDALFVTGNDISVDLNGHSIVGTGTGVGVTVRQRHDVEIFGGDISGFVTGMFISQSSHVTIKENRLTQNREAIFLIGSSDCVVKENEAWENQLRGIMLRPTNGGIPSTGNLVSENLLTDNPSGILIFAQSGNTVKENRISGSTFAALDLNGGGVGGSGNVFKENRLVDSATGVRFGAGWTGNTFVENRIAQNVCGLFGVTTGNTFQENQFVSNGADAC